MLPRPPEEWSGSQRVTPNWPSWAGEAWCLSDRKALQAPRLMSGFRGTWSRHSTDRVSLLGDGEGGGWQRRRSPENQKEEVDVFVE